MTDLRNELHRLLAASLFVVLAASGCGESKTGEAGPGTPPGQDAAADSETPPGSGGTGGGGGEAGGIVIGGTGGGAGDASLPPLPGDSGLPDTGALPDAGGVDTGKPPDSGHDTNKPILELISSAFKNDGDIPTRHTCDGDDISPPLSWEGVDASVQSFALIVDDPDAPDPDAPTMVWVHWVLFDIPTGVRSLPEGVDTLPGTTGVGANDFEEPDKYRYRGPCPPIGKHRYFFKLYALDTLLDLDKPTKDDVLTAMKGHVVDEAELIGLYESAAR